MALYRDRIDAGRQLGDQLGHLRGLDVVILGLARGGVPVAAEVAKSLSAPLDVVVVRKLGVPSQPEVAMGAIAEGGARVLDRRLVKEIAISGDALDRVERRERRALDVRTLLYRSRRPRTDLHGRVAVVVDDGVATGATARAACLSVRSAGASMVILAIPIGPNGVGQTVAEADEVVCLATPIDFHAVGLYYSNFRPTSDEEVLVLLDEADERGARVRD